MARPRKPIELQVLEGKSHRTKAEIEQRRKEELSNDQIPFKDVTAPEYLSESMKKEFDEIAEKLIALNLITELDEDTLGRYLISKQQYLMYTKKLNNALKRDDIDDIETFNRLQDRAYKQCRLGASDLGLTITSRCKLALPNVEPPKENKFMAKFGGTRDR